MKNMKKFILSGSVALIMVFYVVYQYFGGHQVTVPAVSQSQTSSNVSYKDGTYTGSAFDAYYGSVQVKTTIVGGKITGITFLQYPSDRATSKNINSAAMQSLQQEAIAAQSAKVSVVSGATDTSQAFAESLQSALTQAQS